MNANTENEGSSSKTKHLKYLVHLVVKLRIVVNSYILSAELENFIFFLLYNMNTFTYDVVRNSIRSMRRINLNIKESMTEYKDEYSYFYDKMSGIYKMNEKILDNLKTYSNYFGVPEKNTINKSAETSYSREVLNFNRGQCSGARAALLSEIRHIEMYYNLFRKKYSEELPESVINSVENRIEFEIDKLNKYGRDYTNKFPDKFDIL